ncbi:arylesterase [Bacteriovorax sp. Seq25_V]|uniref:arylesterase n=1 Tax=Bacteriovorax sp. Seq25_V TaxID=1201288 RepID=UPI00038A2DA4|nr:arylesterase [Bacteriovorax sp. Seq25_V]EQC43959.1 GDSL-like protein [Bacteriovorax sp. Seq25_V]
MESVIKNLIVKLIILSTLGVASFAEVKVLVLGDSLSEGYGVGKDKSYVNLIQKRLDEEKIPMKITNGSISGSTTSSLASRLKWYLKIKPDYVIVALGANDGLRGLDLTQMNKNLRDGVETIKKANSTPIIFPMLLPPNYGQTYRETFEKTFTAITADYKLKEAPFLLDGVAAQRELNQSDGIHPNIKGHELMAKKLYPFFKGLADAGN